MAQEATPTISNRRECAGGPTLFERYRILGIIGQGGMGTVFKGYHLNLKRFVAIKTLRLDRNKLADLTDRFLREMEVVGQLDHPNVVRAADAGEKNGVFYLVMEYLHGCDLGRLVARHGALAPAEACELIRQAAVGLDYIHQTLVHRDIKPSNLMLTQAGQVKILDLGLARSGFADRREHELTPQGIAVGTYAYISPEQALGNALDGRADIYSLGCTFLKLLTGRTPFSGPNYDSAAKQLHAHCTVCLTTLEDFRNLPALLQPIVAHMVAKDPETRYRTGREVANALEPFASGSQIPQLLENKLAEIEAADLPLPHPFPAEIGLLAEDPMHTPMNTSKVSAAQTVVTPVEGRRKAPLAAGAVAAVLAGCMLIWWMSPFVGQTETKQSATDDKSAKKQPDLTGLVPLDDLPPHVFRKLLVDRAPLAVGFTEPDPRKWRWDKGYQNLEAKGPDHLFFPLGTSTRTRFKFQVGITQTPWTGECGLFWGYREDERLKKAKTPFVDFAWFQFLRIAKDEGPNIKFEVCRGKGALRYNHVGEIAKNILELEHQTLLRPLHSPQAILEIEVNGSRLVHAQLGEFLDRLCSADTNRLFETDPYKGGIGVFAFRHSAIFGNVNFMPLSSN